MTYLVEIIEGEPDKETTQAWISRMQTLRKLFKMGDAELFERIENVRDAHYAYIALYEWSHEKDYNLVKDSGLLEGTINGHVSEWVELTQKICLGQLLPAEQNHVWLINPFEINNQEISDVLLMWDRAKDHMVKHSGFINARLFQARSSHAKYGLVNVAQWQTADQFKKALDDRAYDPHREQSLNYKLHPSLCCRVYSSQGEI